MPNFRRKTDLSEYKGVLPYASELFGVYQSLIGWKSKRQLDRINSTLSKENKPLLSRLSPYLESKATINFNDDCSISADDLSPAEFAGPKLKTQDSVVLEQISKKLEDYGKIPTNKDEWQLLVDNDFLTEILRTKVLEHYNQMSTKCCEENDVTPIEEITDTKDLSLQPEDSVLPYEKKANCLDEVRDGIANEAVIAGAIKELVSNGKVTELNKIFYTNLAIDSRHSFLQTLIKSDIDYSDPYLTFDPKKDIKNVTLSPLGIVHLHRQYFFELDTFLGTPTGHVWLSPGSQVELIEVSTRKTITEKTIETFIDSTKITDTSKTQKDEISEAVKEENLEDLKLGFTATANQTWGTGSASATANLNMHNTQKVAREKTHKRMRTQSEHLSSEIRENYKSTFKTVTEVTDTSSKRHLLANNTKKLINYELRRKMRQVGVQVQDVGTYLCWETFVDDPGKNLGLAELVHYAQPIDLVEVPDPEKIPEPSDQPYCFKVNAPWNFDTRQGQNGSFVVLTTVDVPPAPEGYEVKVVEGIIPAAQVSASGEDFHMVWNFGTKFKGPKQLEIGAIFGSGGMRWEEHVDFVVSVTITYTPTEDKRKEIQKLNDEQVRAHKTAKNEMKRKTKEAYYNAVKERLELASGINKRKFEELREEERIIIYRRLIRSLMTETLYEDKIGQLYDESKRDVGRHVLSELLNSIFDIDKMLYFVAPEWWKPRNRESQLTYKDIQRQLNDNIITWSESPDRINNYLITEKTPPAPMGSSLGWLLQLDGDNLRNTFLNAPWVKAIIPIRPGKEQAALNWLKNVNVEGSDGLNADYHASEDELNEIKIGLELAPEATVTVQNAIDFLCLQVAEKHAESNKVRSYPPTEINDDNQVTATPVDKVFEYGFNPLKDGFRVNPNDPNRDPNNGDKNFQVYDQWIEILPTDQVVPVEVVYDPITGRQIQVKPDPETVRPEVNEIIIIDDSVISSTPDNAQILENASQEHVSETQAPVGAIRPYPEGKIFKLNNPYMRDGKGETDIQAIQRAVGVNPDGVYGPITEKAVRAYQNRMGLKVDGIVGQKTWNVLF